MKTVTDIKNDILQSLGQQDNPVGILLEEYLKKVITDITRDKLIGFQIELSDEELITDYDWSFEDKANEFLSGNKID
jgi:hypothetical protein